MLPQDQLEPGAAASVPVTEQEFAVPFFRDGDVSRYAVDYQYREGDYVYEASFRPRFEVLGGGTYVDGFDQSRAGYAIGEAIRQGDVVTEAATYWVDLETNQVGRTETGPNPAGFRYESSLGNGLYVSRADLNATLTNTIQYPKGNFLTVPGFMGTLFQGRALPKTGSWTEFNGMLDAEFSFSARPATAPAGFADLRLEALNPDFYEVTASAQDPDDVTHDLTFVVSPATAYILSGHVVSVQSASSGGSGWREEVQYSLAELALGQQPLTPRAGQLRLLPEQPKGDPLGDTFPLGGAAVLGFTPRQAKEAVRLVDPDIGGWFGAHPDAFVSFDYYFVTDAHAIAGPLTLLPPAVTGSANIHVSILEFTDPRNGETLGFVAEAYAPPGGPVVPIYERVPWWNTLLGFPPNQENRWTYTQKSWFQNRAQVASLSDALAYYKETAGELANRNPNVILWYAGAGSDGGTAGYILSYVETSTNLDAPLGPAADWTLHSAHLLHNGFKRGHGASDLQWADAYHLAGQRLPLP